MAPSRSRPPLSLVPARTGHEPRTMEECAEVEALIAYLSLVEGVALHHFVFPAHPHALFHLRFDLKRPAAITTGPFRWLWCQTKIDGQERLLLEPAYWYAPDRMLVLIPRWDRSGPQIYRRLARPEVQPTELKMAVLYRNAYTRFDLATIH